MSSFAFSPAELSYLHTSLSSMPPIRPDARTPRQFRPLNAETDVLPAANGSAHLSFSDGSEAIVGVKLEVEKTVVGFGGGNAAPVAGTVQDGGDKMEIDGADDEKKKKARGQSSWISLTLSLPGLRDDDPNLIFLEEMLREALVGSSSPSSPFPALRDTLPINSRWHWHLYIDILLISPHGLAAYPLPLLSLTVYLALRDTRVPALKSEGEEDPSANDDPEAAEWLFGSEKGKNRLGSGPPFTLLVVLVGENVLFDPSREELAVADAVLGVSVTSSSSGAGFSILAVRAIETPARDSMAGVPASRGGKVPGEGEQEVAAMVVPGVWRPKVGGIKRGLLKKVVAEVGPVAAEVVEGLEGFLKNAAVG